MCNSYPEEAYDLSGESLCWKVCLFVLEMSCTGPAPDSLGTSKVLKGIPMDLEKGWESVVSNAVLHVASHTLRKLVIDVCVLKCLPKDSA